MVVGPAPKGAAGAWLLHVAPRASGSFRKGQARGWCLRGLQGQPEGPVTPSHARLGAQETETGLSRAWRRSRWVWWADGYALSCLNLGLICGVQVGRGS